VSTESIATPRESEGGSTPCAACAAPMAKDQRYCLHCGERRIATSSFLQSGHPANGLGARPPAAPPAPAPGQRPDGGRWNALTVIAGVGVLLLAMGVGVLIGRAGNSKSSAAAPAVVTVAQTPAAGTPASSEPTFTDDWPAGTSGYTVQLQTLPQSTTKVSAVQAAKAAASAKGAKNVGALRSEDFSSLTAGNYVIYSGTYHKKAEAQKALGALKRSFPGASVISVSASRPAKASSAAEESAGSAGGGPNINKPAPPSVVEHLHNSKGQSYEQKSKNLPNVISTG
jgi:hypothetical protein